MVEFEDIKPTTWPPGADTSGLTNPSIVGPVEENDDKISSERSMGVKLSDFTTASSTTGTGAAEIWQVDVTGLEKFFTDLTAVAGGNVTIKGRVME